MSAETEPEDRVPTPGADTIYAVLKTLADYSVGMPLSRYVLLVEHLIEILTVMHKAAAGEALAVAEGREDFPP